MARLLVFRDDVVEREIDLGATPVRIGRGDECDLVLDDSSKGVSRCHAELRYEAGRYVLVDLESQNGIWRDGARVARATFQRNTTVTVGPYRLMIDESVTAPAGSGSGETANDATRYMPPAGRSPGGDLRGGAAPGDSQLSAASAHVDRDASQPSWLRTHAVKIGLGAGGALAASAFAVLMFSTSESTATKVSRHIAAATQLIEQGEPQRAIDEHLDLALKLDPNNAEVRELKEKAAEPPKPGNLLQPLVPVPGGGGALPPLPTPDRGGRSTLPSLTPRQAGPDPRAGRDAGTPTASVQLPTAREADSPTAAQIEQNRIHSQALVSAAAEHLANGRFDEAIKAYEAARALTPSAAIDESIKDARDKKAKAAEALVAQGDTQFSFGRVGAPEALRLYEEALKLLAPDHPRRPEINARIKALKR